MPMSVMSIKFLKRLLISNLVFFLFSCPVNAGTLDVLRAFPTSISPDALRSWNYYLTTRLLEEQEKFKQIENDLERRHRQLTETSGGVVSFAGDVMKRFDTLSDEVRSAILNGTLDESRLTLNDRWQLHNLKTVIEEGKFFGNDFIQGLDSYIQKSLDYSILVMMKMASESIELLQNSNLDTAHLKKLIALYRRMHKVIFDPEKGYLVKKIEYGQGKDTHRISAYNKFFKVSEDFFEMSDELQGLRLNEKKPLSEKLRWKLKGLTQLPKYLPLFPDAVKVVWNVLNPFSHGSGKEPLMKSVNEAFRKMSDIQQTRYVVEGREHLPRAYDKGTINIYMPTHRSAMKDMAAISHLGLDHMAPFAAAGNFLPVLKSFLTRLLNKNLGFIVVGNSFNPNPIDPIEKAMMTLELTDIRDFLNYPEGRLPDKQGASGPIREKIFSELGPIKKFEQLGYKINLVPITFASNYIPNGDAAVIDIKIYPMITDEVRRVITTLAGGDGLATLFRLGAINDLKTDSNLLWGQQRASRMQLDFMRLYRRDKLYERDQRAGVTLCLKFYGK